MFLTIHAATGAVIGMQTANPALAFFFSIISHFVLDSLPHGDENLFSNFHQRGKRAKLKCVAIMAADSIITIFATLAIIFFSSPVNVWPVSLGIVGGLLPDMLQTIYFYSGHPWLKNFYDLHNALHYKKGRLRMRLRYGLVFQAGILALILFAVI